MDWFLWLIIGLGAAILAIVAMPVAILLAGIALVVLLLVLVGGIISSL